MMKEAIAKLMNKQDLTYEEARQVMDEIMDGKVSATLISSYLTALSMKGRPLTRSAAPPMPCGPMPPRHPTIWTY